MLSRLRREYNGTAEVSKPHVLGILPARGGSKGIPGKNLKPLCGRPLLSWAAAAIAKAPSVSRSICSTDDDTIADAALASGLEVPFRRPETLAGDTVLVVDVIRHALEALDDPAHPFTHVALVQATTPTVTVDDVEAGIDLVRSGDADTVISGFYAGMNHPSIMYTLNEDGYVSWLVKDDFHAKRRQDFPSVFVRTGIIYIASVHVILERGTLYGDNIRALVVDEERAVTIDEERDFRLVQRLMDDSKNG